MRVRLQAPLLLALILGACGGGTTPDKSAAASPSPTIATTATPAPSPAPRPTGILAAYVGKHPSEPIEGMTFLDQPLVKAAVAAVVPDEKLRDFVFHYGGPDAPIVAREGRILAWGCERHNCGYHNWAVSILPDGSSAEVCLYQDPDRPDGKSTWFLPGGRKEVRPGNCPAE